MDWMREAYRRTRKDAAPGVDQQTAEQYAGNLEENLRSLLERAKAGTYRAPPVRRVHLPKGNGETRPIGIPMPYAYCFSFLWVWECFCRLEP
jgi:retron-type reverse transcriptase